MNPFALKGEEIRKENVGTQNRPYLYNVGPGQRNGQSLVFDLKIGDNFRQVTIDREKSSVITKCIGYRRKGCRARHKFKVKDQFVLLREGRQDGTRTNTYGLNFSDRALRDVSNWEVVEHKTADHSCAPTSFYSQIQRSIREAHTAESLITRKPEFENTLIRLANPNVDLIVETDESDEIQNITISQAVPDVPDVPICDLEPEPTFAVL